MGPIPVLNLASVRFAVGRIFLRRGQVLQIFLQLLVATLAVEVLVLPVDALQPTVAFSVRVDAVSRTCQNLIINGGYPVRQQIVKNLNS